MKNLVVVDVGFGHVKAVGLKAGNFNQVIFESVVARLPALVETGLGAITPADTISFDGQSYLIGAFARDQSRHPIATIDRSRVASDEALALALSALARLYGRSQEDITLIASIPDGWFKDGGGLRDKLIGTHTIKVGAKQAKRTFGVKQVIVRPQSLGAYAASAYSLGQGGKVRTRNESVLAGYTATLDIGYNTVNFGSYGQRGQYRPEFSDSAPLGVYGLISRVTKRVYDDSNTLLQPARIAAAFKSGKLDLAGHPVNFKNGWVAELVDEHAASIVARMTTHWSTGLDYNTLIIASGGAGIFGKAIKTRYAHPNTLMPEVSQFQVAEGLYLWAQKALAK